MDLIQILLLLCAAIGVFLMVFTLVKLKIEDERPRGDSFLETGNSIKAINTSLDEAEKAVDELNKFAASVKADIDTKYQELLFVYNMIDEKKSELKGGYANAETAKAASLSKRADDILAGIAGKRERPLSSPRKTEIHPKHKEIVNLYEGGMSVSEISKKLDMGQGEVKLILELAKAR